MAARAFYQLIAKRSSTFILAIVVTTMFFERAFDQLGEDIFEYYNDGRLWMHIKHKYENQPEITAHEPANKTESDTTNSTTKLD